MKLKALPGRVIPSPNGNKWCFTFSIEDSHFTSEQTFTIPFVAKQTMRDGVKERNKAFGHSDTIKRTEIKFPKDFCLNGGEQ